MDYSKNGRPISILDSKHLMSILLFIYQHGESRKTELYSNVSREVNMPRKLDYLIEKGLVMKISNNKRDVFILTKSGANVAEQLFLLESIILDEGCWVEGEGSADGRGRALSLRSANAER